MEKNILNKIFPHSDNISLLKYDMEGLWSITLPSDANDISQIILNELDTSITILDGTAGLGGNTISFCRFFKKVVAVEMNTNRFKMLESNIKAYNFNNQLQGTQQSCIVINGDCIEHFNDNIDTYFFDPPWGGPEYKQSAKTRIKLGSKTLIEIVDIIKTKYNKMVFMKLPSNYDLDEFNSYNYRIHKIKNYLLIII